MTAQTTSTQIKPLRFSINHNRSWLDIRQPASSGMLFGVAYSITKVCGFATDITFCSQILTPFPPLRLSHYPTCHSEGAKQPKNLETLRYRSW